MNAKDWKWTFDRQISSNPNSCPDVIRELLAALNTHQWSLDDQFGIRVAVEEALMNAIKHGNERKRRQALRTWRHDDEKLR